MAYQGYHFYIGNLELPYAPSKLSITVGSKNETVELIDGSEINILKHPKLTEIEFDVELPRGRQYPFANKLQSPIIYTDFFEKLMVNRTPTQLSITRPQPNGMAGSMFNGFVTTDLEVTLEGYTMVESAENACDIKVSLKFKQYKAYGTSKEVYTSSTPNTSVPVVSKPVVETSKNQTYTVKDGDNLWNIARKFYGDGTKWSIIYNANKTVIEETARKRGKYSSSEGHYIYGGTVLIIPSAK